MVETTHNIKIRNVTLVDVNQECRAVVAEEADNALINDHFTGRSRPGRAVEYWLCADERFGGLRIRNVAGSETTLAGIALSNPSKSGGSVAHAITDNMSTLDADLEVQSRTLEGDP